MPLCLLLSVYSDGLSFISIALCVLNAIFKSVPLNSYVNCINSFPLYLSAINLILWVLGFKLGVMFLC
jgi:hypothetical protein